MDKNSLFINKLNQETIPKISITNIVGVGCKMGNEDGDGVVLKEDGVLEGADNRYIPGSCKTIEQLHTDLLKIDLYPDVYSAIINSLNETK